MTRRWPCSRQRARGHRVPDVWKGRGPVDLVDVSVQLTARMLVLPCRRGCRGPVPGARAIASGLGLERFRRIIEQQDATRASSTTTAACRRLGRHMVTTDRSGFLTSPRCRAVGRTSVGPEPARSWRTSSIPPFASRSWPNRGDELRAGDPVLVALPDAAGSIRRSRWRHGPSGWAMNARRQRRSSLVGSSPMADARDTAREVNAGRRRPIP